MRCGPLALSVALVAAAVGLSGPASAASPDAFSSGLPLYVDPASPGTADARTAAAQGDSGDVPYLVAAGRQSTVDWFTQGTAAQVEHEVSKRVATVRAAHALPTIAVYDIPDRDCGGFSAGGAANASDYEAWIRGVASGLGSGPAAVIVEPDALSHIDSCGLTAAQKVERLGLLRYAVDTLAAKPGVSTYLEAGTTHWHTAGAIATLLGQAGVGDARGFAVNVAGFDSLADTLSFGRAVSNVLGGSHFVIDTGRNGAGPWSAPDSLDPWCNPPGRALGHAPTTDTGVAGVDAYLWIKRPGVSDGTCRGGTVPSGVYSRKLLVELARNAYTLHSSDIFAGLFATPGGTPTTTTTTTRPGGSATGAAATRIPVLTSKAAWKTKGKVRGAGGGAILLPNGTQVSSVHAVTSTSATWTVKLTGQPSRLDLRYSWLDVRLTRNKGFVDVLVTSHGRTVATGRQRLSPGAKLLLGVTLAGGRVRVSVQRHGIGPNVPVAGSGGLLFASSGRGLVLQGGAPADRWQQVS